MALGAQQGLAGAVRGHGADPAHEAATNPHPPLADLTDADRELQEGIPVTAVPRTLLDLAATERFDRLQRALERSEELRLFDLEPVEDLLNRAGTHRGRAPLRRAIALYKPPAFTRSQFERRFLDAVIAHGLPGPAVNINVAGFELDLYWEDERFAVELDSYATHGGPAPFERDRLRQEDLLLVRIGMTRITDIRFDREPQAVLARLDRLLEARREQCGTLPERRRPVT